MYKRLILFNFLKKTTSFFLACLDEKHLKRSLPTKKEEEKKI
jgi:hypothetical protein